MNDRENMGDEAYVRSRWADVVRCDGSYRHYAKGTVLFILAPHVFIESADWKAAADFTEQREREIAEIDEEIMLLKSMIILLSAERGDMTAPVYQRTITRLESTKADLQCGMRRD